MATEILTNKLLYVPFNNDYTVNEEIKKLLTEEEFFVNCFLKPDFKKEKKEILNNSSEEIKAFEIDLTKEDIIRRYEKQENEEEALYNWLETNQNDIYCIKGDAGTGKSTFLHYLKYKYQNSNIQWNIIDIQKAINSIRILGYDISIPEFGSLYSKAISSIIMDIREIFWIGITSDKIDFIKSIENIKYIFDNYEKVFEGYFPSKEVSNFFENFPKDHIFFAKNNIIKCKKTAEYIIEYFQNIIQQFNSQMSRLLSLIIELYLCILQCQNSTKRHMIAFDNFERFIGVDEIYSSQLTEFVSELRTIQNALSRNNEYLSKNFQIIIFMRNTSTRMFTSLQVAELFPHCLDLSEWFQTSKIIEKKIEWYNFKNIEIDGVGRLLEILNDIGGCENNYRGLRSKMNMLFNNDKRVIVRFLTRILDSSLNKTYLNDYDLFKENKLKMSPCYARFAARMIIFRLILNELRNDDFFKHIIVQKCNNEKMNLGYARKILTILYEYKLQNDDSYMNFKDIINKLFFLNYNSINNYFDANNTSRRIIISQVLYYMNYYDGRKDNWLQFIDIQYNIDNSEKIRIRTSNELNKIINDNYESINIRITSAGVAYLYFVVYSIEYFSCKSLCVDNKIRKFGENDLPPLFCAIPSVSDIKTKDINSLVCVKILKIVYLEARECIYHMNEDENSIPFRKKLGDKYVSHKYRIINSHSGFIDNYLFCLKEIYREELMCDTYFSYKFECLINEIENIKEGYKSL